MSVRAQVPAGNATPTVEQRNPTFPGSGPAASDPASGTSGSSQASDDVSRSEPSVDFFRQAFLGTRGISVPDAQPGEANPAGDKQEHSGTDAGNPGSGSTGVEGKPAEQGAAGSTSQPSKTDTPGVVTLTEEELARRVQAETDRVIAKRNREERARREQEEEQRLMDTDPYGYTQKVRERKTKEAELQAQLEKATELTASTVRALDASILDPIMLALPDAERDRIIKEVEIVGVPGRGRAVEEALKSLQQHWKAEGVASARESLLKDQGFIKEVMTRFGGQAPEIEHIPAEGASTGPVREDDIMGAWMRGAAEQIRQRGRAS